jgi:hypothetical protein
MTTFSDICQALFGRPIGNFEWFNLLFGGIVPASSDVYFVNAMESPWINATVGPFNGAVRVVNLTNSPHCWDLQNVSAIANITDEINSIYFRPNCQSESRVGRKCWCNASFSGFDCTRAVHQEENFRIVAISAVLVTSILLLIIGISVWLCGGRTEDETRMTHSRNKWK